jgi:hypothetical protein
MPSIRRIKGNRGWARFAACLAVAVVTMTMLAAPAEAAPSPPSSAPAAAPISLQSVTSCSTSFIPLTSCRTNAIPVNQSTHCVTAHLSGINGWGNIYDTNGLLGTHVGPTNFFLGATVCGLTNWYYMDVRNTGSGLTGVLSS